jgi:translation initiation factor 1
MCPVCRRPLAHCVCASARRAAPTGDGIVRVSRETKGRGGKTVTLVKGLELEPAALLKLAQQLKSACGSGGSVKDGVIEVQGEHRDRIVELLMAQGHDVKKAGG